MRLVRERESERVSRLSLSPSSHQSEKELEEEDDDEQMKEENLSMAVMVVERYINI